MKAKQVPAHAPARPAPTLPRSSAPSQTPTNNNPYRLPCGRVVIGPGDI